jgi:hypothetical protein
MTIGGGIGPTGVAKGHMLRVNPEVVPPVLEQCRLQQLYSSVTTTCGSMHSRLGHKLSLISTMASHMSVAPMTKA